MISNCDLEGLRLVITGGTAGLGAALVRRATARGARVMFCGLIEEQGHALAAETGSLFRVADVRDMTACGQFIGAAEDAFGGLDGAINNAGISHSAARFADLDPHVVEDVWRTNVMGVWYMMRFEIPVLIAGGGGHVINIASILSEAGAEWMAAYGTSKYALIGLTKSAALDYLDAGLHINAVSPGPMRTPMFDRAIEDIGGDLSKYAGGLPPGGPTDPALVADQVLDLLGERDRAPTGANILLGAAQG